MRKYIKNVNVKNCFNVIIIALLAALAAFVPFIFGSETLIFYYEAIPVVGDGLLGPLTTAAPLLRFVSLFTLSNELLSQITEIIAYVSSYHSLVYFGIILLDLAFAILLIITKWTWLRWLFRLFSLIFGIAMIFLTIVHVLYIVGYLLIMLDGTFTINFLFNSFGIAPIIYCLVFSVILIPKQFKWFKKLY